LFGPHPQPCQPHLQASTFALLAGNLKNRPYDAPVLSFKTLIFLLLCPAVLTAQNEPKITVERAPSNVFKLQKNTTYPWKKNITATVFWVGEKPTAKNPTPNNKSSWDQNWGWWLIIIKSKSANPSRRYVIQLVRVTYFGAYVYR